MQPGTRKTLYLELGVPENATREEIRAAYRQLAKDIHPDRAFSGDERETAQRRMTRLNEIVAVLGSEEKRAEYDAELRQQRQAEESDQEKFSVAALEAWRLSARGGPVRNRWPMRLWFAGLICVVAGGAVAVLMSDSRETQWWQTHVAREAPRVREVKETVESRKDDPLPGAKPAPIATVPPAPKFDNRPILGAIAKSPVRAKDPTESGTVTPLVLEARSALQRPPERPVETPQPAPPNPVAGPAPSEVALAAPIRSVRNEEAPVARTPPAAPVPASRDPWVGEWRYRDDLGGGMGGTFSPVTIEMHLSASGNRVRGVYRALYKVPRKYQDTVEFSLDGWVNRSDRLQGVWQDPSGARGEFEVKRLDAKVVEMNWWTTAFGRKQALASGVARLVEIRR